MLSSDLHALSVLVENILKPQKTVKQIAKKHKVSEDVVEKAIKKGSKVEHEHTKDQKIAETIASHHLWEMIDYYDKLEKMERY